MDDLPGDLEAEAAGLGQRVIDALIRVLFSIIGAIVNLLLRMGFGMLTAIGRVLARFIADLYQSFLVRLAAGGRNARRAAPGRSSSRPLPQRGKRRKGNPNRTGTKWRRA